VETNEGTGAPRPSGGLRVDQVAGALLALFAAVVAWESRVLPLGTLSEPGPGYAPMMLAVVLGVVGVVVIALGGGSAAFRDMRWGEAKHAAAILGSCVFAALVLERIGYRLTMLAILLFLLGAVERRRPLTVLLVSFGLSWGSFWLFADFLKTPLPLGPWNF
jgi:putative tricarboxylic transport membrane protein